MAYETIVYEQEKSIALLRINRPDVLNALNRQVFSDLTLLLEEIRKEPTPKVVILTGTGDKAFVAGTDVAEMENLSSFEARAFAGLARRVFENIENFDRPVIAAVNGFALGGGCELAMACDIRIASDRARLGQPEISLGIIPGSGGTQRLARLVGPSKAKQLVFSGEWVDAKTALDIGLVDLVFPHDQLLDETKKVALTMADKSKIALALAKSAINRGFDLDLQSALSYEIECFAQCFATHDQKEGMRAFLEKRKPRFTDK
jgi:enoyl-CoA hydratase